MTHRTAKLVPLLAALAALGACGGGGGSSSPGAGPDAQREPGTDVGTGTDTGTGTGADTGPQTEKERLEARYEITTGTERIAEQLEPGAPDAVPAWNDGAAPLAEGDWKRYDTKASWTWQLLGEPINLSYDANVYVLDMFAEAGRDTIEDLHALGRDAFCYFSVGTYEPWRPDRGFFADDMLGNPHVGYADERWLDVTDPRVVRIMLNRMDMAETIGCDGVELDNLDGYENDSGQPNFTETATIDYARVLANAAHERGMAVALKNVPAILPEVIDWFDLSINESCHHFNECTPYGLVTSKGKPVFNAEYGVWADTLTQIPPGSPEYEAGLDAVCERSRELDLRTLLLPKALDGSSRYSCDDRQI